MVTERSSLPQPKRESKTDRQKVERSLSVLDLRSTQRKEHDLTFSAQFFGGKNMLKMSFTAPSRMSSVGGMWDTFFTR